MPLKVPPNRGLASSSGDPRSFIINLPWDSITLNVHIRSLPGRENGPSDTDGSNYWQLYIPRRVSRALIIPLPIMLALIDIYIREHTEEGKREEKSNK